MTKIEAAEIVVVGFCRSHDDISPRAKEEYKLQFLPQNIVMLDLIVVFSSGLVLLLISSEISYSFDNR